MALAAFADPDSFTVSVSGGNVFTISRSDASAAGWVEYYTQSGSAVAGIHYEDVAGRLEFAKGESSKISKTRRDIALMITILAEKEKQN